MGLESRRQQARWQRRSQGRSAEHEMVNTNELVCDGDGVVDASGVQERRRVLREKLNRVRESVEKGYWSSRVDY